jgi:hypothetical protein
MSKRTRSRRVVCPTVRPSPPRTSYEGQGMSPRRPAHPSWTPGPVYLPCHHQHLLCTRTHPFAFDDKRPKVAYFEPFRLGRRRWHTSHLTDIPPAPPTRPFVSPFNVDTPIFRHYDADAVVRGIDTHLRLGRPLPVSLDWDDDPRLADLSRALQALGWIRR